MKGEEKFGQTLMQKVFQEVPEADRAIIMKRKAGSLDPTKEKVRIQCYIPADLYVTLTYFGAFQTSESHFFTSRAVEYIQQEAMKLGMFNVMQHRIAGGR